MHDHRVYLRTGVSALGLLFASWYVSESMLIMVVFVGAVGSLAGLAKPLQRYGEAVALSVLVLGAFFVTAFGYPSGWVIALSTPLAVLISMVAAFRGRTVVVPFVSSLSALTLSYVIVGSMAIAKWVFGSASLAWGMGGDALNWILAMRQMRALPAGGILGSDYFPFMSMGQALAANAVAELQMSLQPRSLRIDIESGIAVLVVSAIVAGGLALRLVSGAVQSRRQSLMSGLLVALVASSGLVLGFTASNGYLSSGLTVALYFAGLISIWRFSSTRNWIELAVGGGGGSCSALSYVAVSVASSYVVADHRTDSQGPAFGQSLGRGFPRCHRDGLGGTHDRLAGHVVPHWLLSHYTDRSVFTDRGNRASRTRQD